MPQFCSRALPTFPPSSSTIFLWRRQLDLQKEKRKGKKRRRGKKFHNGERRFFSAHNIFPREKRAPNKSLEGEEEDPFECLGSHNGQQGDAGRNFGAVNLMVRAKKERKVNWFPRKKRRKKREKICMMRKRRRQRILLNFLPLFLVSAGELWENAQCPVAKKGKREERRTSRRFCSSPYSKPLLVLAYKMYDTTCMLIY